MYLPGFFSLPATDPLESLTAQTSRELALSWQALPPGRVSPAPSHPPPLIHWIQAPLVYALAAGNLAGDAIWMYRVPSLLAAIAVVLLTRRIGLAMFDGRVACLAAALLAVSPALLWNARQADAAAVGAACTCGALFALWLIHSRGASAARQGALWVCVALGTLASGATTFIIVALAAISLGMVYRRWSWLLGTAPLFGVVILGVLCAPWLFAALSGSNAADGAPRAMGRWWPPGAQTLLVFLLLFPVCLCIPAAVKLALAHARRVRRHPEHGKPAPDIFLVCWALPAWIVLELIGTDGVGAMLPLFPPLALLAARLLLRPRFLLRRVFFRPWVRPIIACWMLVALAACCAGIAVVSVPLYRGGHPVLGYAVVGIGLAMASGLAWSAWRSWERGRVVAQHLFVAALAAFAGALICMALPGVNVLWPSRTLAAIIARNDAGGVRPLAAVGEHENSLAFETRGRASPIDAAAIAGWLADHPGGLLVIDELVMNELPTLRSLGGTRGFDLSRGRWVHIALAEAAP